VADARPGQPVALSTPGRVGWHELLAADWEKAFAFYAEHLRLAESGRRHRAVGTYQLFSAGGETIGGMFTKPRWSAVPFWLYYFNIRRHRCGGEARAGGRRPGPQRAGRSAGGGSWIVQCTDPQGAIFALAGKRSHNGIGYFERVPRDPSGGRFGGHT
jgi:predicted enzyme related to lactoylglutathione lyase